MHSQTQTSFNTDIHSVMQVAGRKSARFEVEYRGHQIQPCEAILLLAAESGCGISGSSVAFRLKGQVTGAKPQVNVMHDYIL